MQALPVAQEKHVVKQALIKYPPRQLLAAHRAAQASASPLLQLWILAPSELNELVGLVRNAAPVEGVAARECGIQLEGRAGAAGHLLEAHGAHHLARNRGLTCSGSGIGAHHESAVDRAAVDDLTELLRVVAQVLRALEIKRLHVRAIPTAMLVVLLRDLADTLGNEPTGGRDTLRIRHRPRRICRGPSGELPLPGRNGRELLEALLDVAQHRVEGRDDYGLQALRP
mmetsp:Transcript_105278/g.296411  ORF Transcript_105278/g.296411 Transcript_105278/m.296411 type:complete len:227 (+) Transcript_105278:731-1411(+)